ncbi:carboxy-S-adenosyl-L-methionine synthase CmoA [Candidatus Marinamargulisbacteria bacterium SCGC AG-410-N11]|nr:carboxy-S-adenosyl-L-methionine synthase CmoA [Candidatus Marinamargulisbacteria bacterium SCGC AG-410-N11]
MKDTVYLKKKTKISSFKFNQEVTNVFDDMLVRSVPLYEVIHKSIINIIKKVYFSNCKILDLGCSNGKLFSVLLSEQLNVKYIGVDSSPFMIKEALGRYNDKNCQFITKNIDQDFKMENIDIVVANLTIQFIQPEIRQQLIKNLYHSLNKNSYLIIVEKEICENNDLAALFTEIYHDFKKQHGYSDLEIQQKIKALKNILIPFTAQQNIDLLKNAGFEKINPFIRWFNFSGYIAKK